MKKIFLINVHPALNIMMVIKICVITPGEPDVSHVQSLGYMGHVKIGLGSAKQEGMNCPL